MARSLRSRNAVLLILGLLFDTFAFGAPAISTISPTAGPVSPVGSALTINGSGFGASASGNTVTIGGVAAAPTSWSDTNIVVPVPGVLLPGFADVIVTSGGTASNTASFLVIPIISNDSPASGPVGTSVVITGTSFGDTQGASTVTFNGVTASPTSWSNTNITVSAPSLATTGDVVVTVNGFSTNGPTFRVLPNITAIGPTAGPIGSSVTISGTTFGQTQGFGSVTFNGVGATVQSWSDSSITVVVPVGATSGNVVVTDHQLLTSNGLNFNVISQPAPVINFISPDTGRAGIGVTISGSNFSGTQSGGTVTFNGLPATINSWSDNSISASAPAGVHSGPVIVTTIGGASNGVQFTFAPGIRTQAQPLYITPDEISLEVGSSGAFKVVDASGNPVLDATWTVDSADLATIAADDPTLPTATLQALAPGEVTITATSSLGTAQTKATIFGAGLMPDGSASWGFYPETQDNFFDFKIRSRRNKESDPYLYLPEGTNDFTHLSALSENGQLMWRTTLNPLDPSDTFSFPNGAAGTNDGGVLVHSLEGGGINDPFIALYRFGADHTPLWTYRSTSVGLSEPAIGPDGTVYVLDLPTLIAIDDTTGTEKFRFSPAGGSSTITSAEQPGTTNPDGSQVTADNPWKPCADFFIPGTFQPPSPTPPGSLSFNWVIGTDGSVYLMSTVVFSSFNYDKCQIAQVGTDPATNHPIYDITSMSGQLQYNSSVQLLRVTSSGDSAATQIGSISYSGQAGVGPGAFNTIQWTFNNGASQLPQIRFDQVVPDADGGALIAWLQQSSVPGDTFHGFLTKVLNDSPVSTHPLTASGVMATNDQGTVFFSESGVSVTALDIASGALKWTLPGTLLALTDDGGAVIQTGFSVVYADADGVLDPNALAVAGTASYTAIGTFQVAGQAGSVTSVPTGVTSLNQIIAVPWPVPKFANPQHTFKAKGDKTSQPEQKALPAGLTEGCTGYDENKVDVAAVMAPADGINPSTGQTVVATGNTFNFRAPGKTTVKLIPTDTNALTLSVDDPSHPTQLEVTVPGDGISHQITLLGHGTAISPVRVIMLDPSSNASLQTAWTAFQGIVLPYRFWQIHKFSIADAANNTTSGATPTAATIAAQINRAFKAQANVEVGVLDRGLVDAFHWDINGDHEMHFANHWDPPNFTENNEAGPLNNYVTTIFDGTPSPLLTQGWTMYLYYVRDFDNSTTEGFTVLGKANRSIPSIVKTTYNVQINIDEFMANLTAHEIGHKLGLDDRKGQSQQDHFYIMQRFQPGNLLFKGQNTPCKLDLGEWKTANQP